MKHLLVAHHHLLLLGASWWLHRNHGQIILLVRGSRSSSILASRLLTFCVHHHKLLVLVRALAHRPGLSASWLRKRRPLLTSLLHHHIGGSIGGCMIGVSWQNGDGTPTILN